MSAPATARGGARLARAKRVVVKIGSALLVEKSTGRVNRAWLETLKGGNHTLNLYGPDGQSTTSNQNRIDEAV